MSSSNDQHNGKKDKDSSNILEGFSFVQVLASGLAAGTSFAFSAQIGVAGSLIGAILGAFASTAAMQIYKNILNKSAEKLQEMGPDISRDHSNAEETPAGPSATDQTALLDDLGRTTPVGTDETFVAGASQTAVQPKNLDWQPTSLSGRTTIEEVSESGTPVAPEEIRREARARKQKTIRRRAAIFCTIVAIVVVLVFALVVSVATQGSGINVTPEDLVFEQVSIEDGTEADEQAEDQDALTTGNGAASGTSSAETNTTDSSATGDANATGSSSDASTTGNGTDNDSTTDTSTEDPDASSSDATDSSATDVTTDSSADADEEASAE